MLDERLQALLRDVEQVTPHDQRQLADQLEEWLEDIEWRRAANEPGRTRSMKRRWKRSGTDRRSR